MIEPDTSAWRPLGETANTRYFEIEPAIVIAVPHAGTSDTEPTARENQAFQNDHWRKAGHGGVVLVLFDRMVSQDAGARRVYQTEPDLRVMRATALVGGSLLGRAMISFFSRISKPRVPVKTFATIDEAITWARSVNRAAQVGEASA